ncbi:MAG: hypothetical protein OHK0028_14960 [Deltaproteobacteria bacterium]
MKRHFVSAVLASVSAIAICGTALADAGEKSWRPNVVLLEAYFHGREALERIDDKIRHLDAEIGKNERSIRQAGEIVRRSEAQGNAKARALAEKALGNSLRTKERNEATKREYLSRRAALRHSIATVLQRMSPDAPGSETIRGVVTVSTGKVELLRKDGGKVFPSEGGDGVVRPGDEIRTYAGARAEVQLLDGRGTVVAGPDTRVKVLEDTPDRQVVEQIRGTVYTAVDRADDAVRRLWDGVKRYRDDLQTIGALDMEEWEKYLKLAAMRFSKRFELKTPTAVCGVRGTRFAVDVGEDGTTCLAVLEGSVEISCGAGAEKKVVEAGKRVTAVADRVFDPEPAGTMEAWWER